MFKKITNDLFSKENKEKDFKKLAQLVKVAKGYRSIGNFAADCELSDKLLEDILNMRITTYPSIKYLEIISDNSEGRVYLHDLKVACGYSLYENNDREEIKNIYVRRGWFCYVNYGDKSIDSELGGIRIALVIQNDKGNKFSPNTIVLPLTSRRSKKQLPTHVFVPKECGLKNDSVISCELVNTVSKRRLLFKGGIEKVSECPESIMRQVEVALAKAQGTIGLDVNENEAIQVLTELNRDNKYKNTYNNSYNDNRYHKEERQIAFA